MSPKSNRLEFISELAQSESSRLTREATDASGSEINSASTPASGTDNVTSALPTTGSYSYSTPGLTANSSLHTSLIPTTEPHEHNSQTGTIVAAAITAALLIALVASAVYLFYYKRRRLPPKSSACFQPIRKRRSSTSDSRRALDGEENADKMAADEDDEYTSSPQQRRLQAQGQGYGEGEGRDVFTIEDFEEVEENRGGDEYFYDEVFGHSQFEDETTNNSVRKLYTSEPGEEELLDFDFETLGIEIGDYSSEDNRRNLNI